MRRRRFLTTAVAGVGAVGGCLNQSDSEAATTGPAGSSNGDESPEEQRETAGAAIDDVTVAPEIVVLDSPDSIGTLGERGDQFLLASAASTGDGSPDCDEFALETGGETYGSVDAVDGRRVTQLWNVEERGTLYGDDQAGWLLFQCPKPLDADDAAITWPGGEYALDDGVAAELARPTTTFEVVEYGGPETIAVGEEIPITLTVRNTGDADGTFVGGLNIAGGRVAHAPETAVRLEVPAGETATWSYEHPDGDHMSFILNWRAGRRTYETEVETE